MNIGDRVLIVRTDWEGADKILTGATGTIIAKEEEEPYIPPFIDVQLDVPTEVHGDYVRLFEEEFEVVVEEVTAAE